MPRYRAKEICYVDTLRRPGEEFEYAGSPGANLEPLDDAARDAKALADKRRAHRPGLRTLDGKRPVEPPKPTKADVTIPENWVELPPKEVVTLSRRLGAPKNNRYPQAVAFIEKELARRAAAKETSDG
jgi:hypothetical protein